MDYKTSSIRRLAFILAIVLNINFLYATGEDSSMVSLFDKSLEELVNQEVTIATKSTQKINQTPSVVSVITSEEIKALGFQDIFDVLKIIPGFEYTQTFTGTKALGIRGVMNIKQGGRFLVLLDGVPHNGIMYGSGLYFGHEFNLDAIDRIEIIRGPGSSLYGRNAFSSVMNIITKKGKENNRLDIGGSVGNFNTLDFHSSYQIKKNNFKAFISTKYYNSDGTNAKFNNGMNGKSLWNVGHENYYINTNFQYKNLQVNFSYNNRTAGGNSPFYYMTDCFSYFKNFTYSLDYSKSLSSRIELSFKAYGRNENRVQDIEFLKSGINDTIPGLPYTYAMVYPEGLYANAKFDDYTYGTEIQLNFKFIKNNDLMLGIQTDIHGVSNATTRINYLPDNTYQFLANYYYDNDSNRIYYTKENMPIFEGWIKDNGHDYQNLGIYIQDIHYITEELGITIGARLDLDSETGSILNPRLGLVWNINDFFTIKGLYGEAYRTPTTSEQYKRFGYDQGNENLDYEEIKTTELVFLAKKKRLFSQISLFHNKLDNIIIQSNVDSLNTNTYFNIGKNTSYGIDFENKFIVSNLLYLFYNFSYKISNDTQNGIEITHPNISKHISVFGLNYKLTPRINYSGYLLYHGPMSKYPNRNFPDMEISQDIVADYLLLNSSVSFKAIKRLDISIHGYNLLNKKYYFQDDLNAKQPAQSGIQFIIKANYIFN